MSTGGLLQASPYLPALIYTGTATRVMANRLKILTKSSKRKAPALSPSPHVPELATTGNKKKREGQKESNRECKHSLKTA